MSSKDLPDFSFEVAELNKAKGTVTIKADKASFASATKRLNAYKALPFRFRPALEGISNYVRMEMIPATFTKEGPGWKPLARRTVAERIQAGFGGHHPILKRSGDLFKELTEKSHPRHIEVIKTGKNARIEIGGSSEKFKQNQSGRGDPGQRLPQRPMIPGTGNIPISQRDRLAMKAIIMRSIRNANMT